MLNDCALRQAAAGFAAWGCLIGDDAFAQVAVPTPPPAAASVGDGGAVTAYPPAFFAEFKPASAFDMVQRLPGFSFNGGADVRGFGGAAGNVLIDGERPSSKAVPLQQILQRIPISQVERIDLVRDGAAGVDMQGQPVVANVIRKTGASATGAVQLLLKPFGDGFIGFIPRIEGAWRSGPLSLDGQLGYRNDRTANSGEGPVWRRSAAGATLQSGTFKADDRHELTNFSASAEYRPGVDVLRLNLSGAHEIGTRRERSDLSDGLAAFQVLNNSVEEDYDWEVGGDYERPLNANLTGRLIALATFATEDATGRSQGRGLPEESRESSEGGERIVRGVLNATAGERLRLEGGAEAAFNYLDSRTAITEGGVPVILPSADVRVEERRGEVFGTANWRAADALSAEAGVRYERSTIRQTGGVDQEKTLSFLKPRLIVSWTPDDASQLRGRIEREVGQLEFGDFAASAQLDTGAHNAGNPDLEPERAWVAEVAYERRFWGSGAAVVTISHAAIESVVDLIPIDGRFDAPGNIGDGWRNTARLNLSLPFDRFGLGGALLKFNGTWRDSEVTDPVTGRPREISGDAPYESDWVFSQALPSLNAVLAIETVMDFKETSYRINEVRSQGDSNFVKIYWDWTPRPDLLFRFQIENATAKTTVRKRTLHSGPRSAGLIGAYERREAQFDPFLMMRMRKTF